MFNTQSNVSFPFDDIFNDHREYIDHLIQLYKQLYRLPMLRHESTITDEQVRYVRSRRHFVLLSLYNDDKCIFLNRDMSPDFGWSLPGGSIKEREPLFDAINRHARTISAAIQLGEIEPICLINNVFNNSGHSHEHFGIAFNTRVRNPDCIRGDTPGQFVRITDSELDRIKRLANREVVIRCASRLRQFGLPVAENEVAASEASAWRYGVHNRFVKRFLLTDARKKKTELNKKFDQYVKDANFVLDPSCGDSGFLQSLLARNAQIEVAVANDISWETTKYIRADSPKILFTNHDAIYLPFEENTFDVAICSNTLHHMANAELMKALLERLFFVSRRVVLYEIENPHDTGGFPKLLNRYYYHAFLKDQGVAYLRQNQFKSLVSAVFGARGIIEFDAFENIQGRYMVAVVDKKHLRHLEVEDKRELPATLEEILVSWLKSNGFRPSIPSTETDEYFSNLDGEFVKNRTCLRIRDSEQAGGVSLDYKEGTSPGAFSSSFAKHEYNLKITKSESAAAREILRQLGFTPYITVKKERTVWERVDRQFSRRVCVDILNDADKFVEFELVTHDDAANKTDMRLELQKFIETAGLASARSVNNPYRDIVATKRRQELNPNKANVILFDLDGTIVPTEELFFGVWQKVSRETYNVEIQFAEYVQYEMEQDGALFRYLVEQGRFDRDVLLDDYMSEIYGAYRIALKEKIESGAYKRSFAPIKSLETCYRLGLVTTSKREFVEGILAAADDKPQFEVLICREDVSRRKPDPQAYSEALNRMRASVNDVIAIEDSKRGALAAAAAGIHTILIKNSGLQFNGWSQSLLSPVCDSLSECCLLLLE